MIILFRTVNFKNIRIGFIFVLHILNNGDVSQCLIHKLSNVCANVG